MKKFLSLFLFFVFSANSAFGSPLLYKVSKNVAEEGKFSEIGKFDASKFRQVRITIIGSNVEDNFISLEVFALEDKEITIYEFRDKNFNKSVVIDSPPPQLVFRAYGKGDYSVYIWGQ